MTHDELLRAAGGIQLIALDLDGTALTSGPVSVLTPRTTAALRAAADRGILVVPATGRSIRSSIGVYPELSIAPYIISVNGGLVTDLRTGEHLYQASFPAQVAAELVMALLDEPENSVYLNTLDRIYTAYRDGTCFPAPGERKPFGIDPDTAVSLRDKLLTQGDEVLEIGLHYAIEGGMDRYGAVARRFPQVDFFEVGYKNVEFVGRGGSKGSSLRLLCEHLGIPASRVCALGDNGNDAEMLSWAGIGVAMGNAIPAAKEAADHITADNDHEGVAEFLETYILSIKGAPL